jgi:hypothetical protein
MTAPPASSCPGFTTSVAVVVVDEVSVNWDPFCVIEANVTIELPVVAMPYSPENANSAGGLVVPTAKVVWLLSRLPPPLLETETATE